MRPQAVMIYWQWKVFPGNSGSKLCTRYKRAPAREERRGKKNRHREKARRGDLFANVDYQRYLDAIFHCRQITTGCALVMTWVFGVCNPKLFIYGFEIHIPTGKGVGYKR